MEKGGKLKINLFQAHHERRHCRPGRNRRRDVDDRLQSIKFIDFVISESHVFQEKFDRSNLFDQKFERPKIFEWRQTGSVRKRRQGQRVLREKAHLRKGCSNKSAKGVENFEPDRDRHQQVVFGDLRLRPQPPQLGLGDLLRDHRLFVRTSGPSEKFEIRRFVQIRFYFALL